MVYLIAKFNRILMRYSWPWLFLVLLMPVAWLMIPFLFLAVVLGALYLLVHRPFESHAMR